MTNMPDCCMCKKDACTCLHECPNCNQFYKEPIKLEIPHQVMDHLKWKHTDKFSMALVDDELRIFKQVDE